MKKCDFCNKPAVVHETTVKSGVAKEVHLCRSCAERAGVVIPVQPKASEIIQQFVIATAAIPPRRTHTAPKLVCETCGTTFSEFRHTGTLGCPSCYEAFDKHLSPLIERAQGGATHHNGKRPRNCGAFVDRAAQINRLLRELNSAVAAEQYERAAELRDRLSGLERETKAASTSTSMPTITIPASGAGAGTGGVGGAGAGAGAGTGQKHGSSSRESAGSRRPDQERGA